MPLGPTRRETVETWRRRRRARMQRARERRGNKRAANRSLVMHAIRQIPAFLKLLAGLMGDRRVAAADKLFVAGAIAYVLLPVDFIADFIPFIGMVDDVFLLATTIRRLIRNAGYGVAMRYWKGDPEDLRRLRIEQLILAAATFLPLRMRRRLQRGR